MGIDPLTHEPFISYSPTAITPASPTIRHMTQWESARLQAEARLSTESWIFNIKFHPGRTDADYFLRLWNSEVGESFRKFSRGCKTACSSSTKCESASALTAEISPNFVDFSATASEYEHTECKSCKSNIEDSMAGSDSSSSIDLENSSDTALQLLLDFPINNDMSFLEEENSSHHATTTHMLTENSCICPL